MSSTNPYKGIIIAGCFATVTGIVVGAGLSVILKTVIPQPKVTSCRVIVTRYLVANNDFASIMVGYVTVDGRQQRNAPYERDGYFYGPFPAATVKADNYEPVEEIDMYKLYSDGTQATITNYKLCLAEINK